MTVSVLVITHEEIGSALISAATTTLGCLPLPTTVVTVSYDSDPELMIPKLQQLAKNIEHGQGLLILTDLYGSTPSNIATSLRNNSRIKVISGLNLPMLIRTMNYADADVETLAMKALSGGRDGIISCNEAIYAQEKSDHC